jgi:chromatin structure-remodeling complex subunit RSC3/30
MVGAFAMDKQLATFLGRPPLISWRYCDVPFPLDLSYDEVVAEPDIRDAAIAKLEGNNGWNTDGSPSKGGWARAILVASIIREKVLELSLCRQADDLGQKVECVYSPWM